MTTDAGIEVADARGRVVLRLAELRALALAGAACEVELLVIALSDLLADPSLPFDFVRGARAEMRELELNANMKACDMALRRALAFPKARRKPQRVEAVSTARLYLRRAALLGASELFRRGAERTIDAALLTDGLQRECAPRSAQ